MKHYIVLDKIDLSKLNNNDDEVKIEVNGETVYLCSEDYFRSSCWNENNN